MLFKLFSGLNTTNFTRQPIAVLYSFREVTVSIGLSVWEQSNEFVLATAAKAEFA